MRRYLLFCALGALFGCRTVSEPSGTAIALFCSTSEQSKTDILTQDDEIAVFARIEGTESCFLEAVKFTVKADGHSLMTAPAVAYPETNQAIHFFAYFPYHMGAFSVPTDQSQPEALKQADLCGATASSTPVATPVALEFRHLLARLVITTNEPTEKITFPNAVASGVVHAATAELVLGTVRTDIRTDKNELIVPVQPLSRLVLTVSNVEYVFDTAPITLEAGKTTTLDLTLHLNTHTATLSGSSVTDWVATTTTGNLTHAVSNVLTLHWSNHLLQGATPDRVVFTIGGTDYTVASGVTYANKTFTVPFASSALRYPYIIQRIQLYESTKQIATTERILGETVYKAGGYTLGENGRPLNPPTESDYVKIGSLYWARGNLVAVSKENNRECKVGIPADHGLYFQFGSLIGYKGGALANGGTGVGSNPYTGSGTQWWGGKTSFSWANDAMVWPADLLGNPTSWPQGATTNQWYFGLQAGWSSSEQNIRNYPNFSTGGLSSVGVGDPCTYYLGDSWRLPTTADYITVCNNQGGNNSNVGWVAAGASWTGTPVNGGNFLSNRLFFSASGFRNTSNGSFNVVTAYAYYCGSSVLDATSSFYLHFASGWIGPRYNGFRSYAFPVRCVSSVAP